MILVIPSPSYALTLWHLRLSKPRVQATQANVTTSYYLCRCGEYHVSLEAIGAIAIPSTPRTQFDGSAHSQVGVGGAGAALFLVSYRGLELVDWSAYALPQCADNVVAEAYGALAALQLYQLWTARCTNTGGEPHLLHAIQGDIKPLLQHLQFTGRLRRSDLISTIDDFHQARSLLAPSCQLLYRPREVNFIADFLAGQGSRFLIRSPQTGTSFP